MSMKHSIFASSLILHVLSSVVAAPLTTPPPVTTSLKPYLCPDVTPLTACTSRGGAWVSLQGSGGRAICVCDCDDDCKKSMGSNCLNCNSPYGQPSQPVQQATEVKAKQIAAGETNNNTTQTVPGTSDEQGKHTTSSAVTLSPGTSGMKTAQDDTVPGSVAPTVTTAINSTEFRTQTTTPSHILLTTAVNALNNSAILTTTASAISRDTIETGNATDTLNAAASVTTENGTQILPAASINTSAVNTTDNGTQISIPVSSNTSAVNITDNSTQTSYPLSSNTSAVNTTDNSTQTSYTLSSNTSAVNTTDNSTQTPIPLSSNTSAVNTIDNSTQIVSTVFSNTTAVNMLQNTTTAPAV